MQRTDDAQTVMSQTHDVLFDNQWMETKYASSKLSSILEGRCKEY